MIYKYRINLSQQLRLLLQPVLLHLGIIGAVYYRYRTISLTPLLITLGGVFLLDTLPALFLHIQYLSRNYKAEFSINTMDRTFSYLSKQKEKKYSFSEIKLLEYYVSYARKTGVYSFSRYRYYKIILTNGDVIVVTCLMINNIENTLESLLRIKAEKELRVLCFIK